MPSSSVISFMAEAMSTAICSPSSTQGPAIKKNGRSSPMSKPQSFMFVVLLQEGAPRKSRPDKTAPEMKKAAPRTAVPVELPCV